MPDRPKKTQLPADEVREFRKALEAAFKTRDDYQPPRTWSAAKWGVYAFYDYDGEPIYVGQSMEQVRVRIRRHLTNQRTDAVAMRILDVFEVAEIEMWPLWEYENLSPNPRGKSDEQKALIAAAKKHLNALEYSAYLQAIDRSRFKAILNEKIPPLSEPIDLPPSIRLPVINPEARAVRGHPDVRIARRAETISRLAAVAHERGEVNDGLRRVLVIQAVRLAYLAACRLAYVEGRNPPDPSEINTSALVGQVLVETDPEPVDDEELLA